METEIEIKQNLLMDQHYLILMLLFYVPVTDLNIPFLIKLVRMVTKKQKKNKKNQVIITTTTEMKIKMIMTKVKNHIQNTCHW